MQPDKILFTPGPLTTSVTVKQAMLRDLGSRDQEFITTVKEIRYGLLNLAGVSQHDGYEAVIMQGSGTFGIESVISSVIPVDGHLLVIINGAYGERISSMAEIHGIRQTRLVCGEDEHPSLSQIENALEENPSITHVVVVHCETTTGIINPIEDIGKLANQYHKTLIVDAMSSFGAVPIDFKESHIDFLISSSNKCIEGVPGFSFIIARRKCLLDSSKIARTMTLNLYQQWKALEETGQFRFTPPTHTLMAFRQALDEIMAEGGVIGRAGRYAENYKVLIFGMREMGFKEYLSSEKQGYIITSFHCPKHPNFDFASFYKLLSDKGQVIYPGKLSKADCFRIGNIGRISTIDIAVLLACIRATLEEMEVDCP